MTLQISALFLLIFVKNKIMNFLLSLLSSLLMTFNFIGNDIPYTSLEEAFISNNASQIVALSKEKILLNILGNEGAYSQSQATLVLKDFFTKKPSTSFKFIFKGKESTDGSFCIGTYISKNESYRITIQFKKINTDYKIESLTIEKS